MNSVEKFNIVSNLQMELCHEFLLYLNGKDIFKTGNVFKLPKAVMENEYFWRLKLKTDKLQLKRHQYSENFENFQKNFRCTEQAFYVYLEKLRQNWLTKSWSDALNPIVNGRQEAAIKVADERFIFRCRNRTTNEIVNLATNQVISRYKTRQVGVSQCILKFPFVVNYDWFNSKLYLWNAEENKLMWLNQFSRTLRALPVFSANDNTIATLTNDATQISLIDMSSGIIKANLPHAAKICDAQFCNKFLITTTTLTNFPSGSDHLHVWDVDNQILKYSIEREFLIILNDPNDDVYAILLQARNIYSQVLNLEEGTLHEFETNLDYERFSIDLQTDSNAARGSIIVRRPKVIFFDVDNNLNVVNYTTRACIAKRNFQVEINMISANSNFIFVHTMWDIRIVDNETCRELRIFSPTKAIFGREIKNTMLSFFKALESKLILQYHSDFAIFDDPCSQFTLDFNI